MTTPREDKMGKKSSMRHACVQDEFTMLARCPECGAMLRDPRSKKSVEKSGTRVDGDGEKDTPK